MEPRLGRMFHSWATGRRLTQLFLRRLVFVKRLAPVHTELRPRRQTALFEMNVVQ
jgi:hypothetical protein